MARSTAIAERCPDGGEEQAVSDGGTSSGGSGSGNGPDFTKHPVDPYAGGGVGASGWESPQRDSAAGPAYGQPAYGQQAYGQPAYGQPAYGQPTWGPYGAAPPGGHPVDWQGAPETDGNAIAALVCAIAAWVVCPVILAIVALVLARSSDRAIAASGGRRTGHSLNTAARWIAWVHLGVMALIVVAGVIVLAAFAGFGGSSSTY